MSITVGQTWLCTAQCCFRLLFVVGIVYPFPTADRNRGVMIDCRIRRGSVS